MRKRKSKRGDSHVTTAKKKRAGSVAKRGVAGPQAGSMLSKEPFRFYLVAELKALKKRIKSLESYVSGSAIERLDELERQAAELHLEVAKVYSDVLEKRVLAMPLEFRQEAITLLGADK